MPELAGRDLCGGDLALDVEIAEVEEVEDSAENEVVDVVEEIVDSSVSAVEESMTEARPAPAPVNIADESMDEGEMAFNILVSLGMVEQTPDPDDAEYDSSKDDELAPHTTV